MTHWRSKRKTSEVGEGEERRGLQQREGRGRPGRDLWGALDIIWSGQDTILNWFILRHLDPLIMGHYFQPPLQLGGPMWWNFRCWDVNKYNVCSVQTIPVKHREALSSSPFISEMVGIWAGYRAVLGPRQDGDTLGAAEQQARQRLSSNDFMEVVLWVDFFFEREKENILTNPLLIWGLSINTAEYILRSSKSWIRRRLHVAQ